MSPYMFEYSPSSPNLILSSSGHSIQIRGRAGIVFRLEGESIEIDSEMLFPPMSIAIYSESFSTNPPELQAEILDEVVRGLQWAGFAVEII